MSGLTDSEALNVLIIEDQHDIAANIWDFLERRGYRVDHAADGRSGLQAALRGTADVIVLDLGLPRLDGLDLCRQLRAAGHGVPILMLTARDTLDDKLRGLAEGADDYMVKPFAMRELEARIRAVHRRGKPMPSSVLQVGDLRFDPGTMVATRRDVPRTLTRSQAQLLEVLMRASPRVVPRATLIRALWGERGGESAALQTHIYDLRSLIDRGSEHPLIHTVHGVGYRMYAS